MNFQELIERQLEVTRTGLNGELRDLWLSDAADELEAWKIILRNSREPTTVVISPTYGIVT